MKKGIKREENILMIVYALMAFSIGIWGNYRQLWLDDFGFSVTEISRILSVALVCSAVISFIISIFSAKVRVKNVVFLSIIFRSVSMLILFATREVFWIKFSILLSIMCDVIFSIAFYPLLTFVTKTDESYRKKTFIEYFAKDIGIISCGLLIGVSLGKYVFNYNTCLSISIVSSILASIVLLLFRGQEKHNRKEKLTLKKSFIDIFSSKLNRFFLYNQLVINISYAIVFDLIMIILTQYVGFKVAVTSVFIIVCNVLGNLVNVIFNKFGKNLSIKNSSIIKFGIRALGYLIAFILNNNIGFIIAIVFGFITSRILEDKVTGVFLQLIDEENQFLHSNIRYFVSCIGEGIGTFIAGILLMISFKYIFLGAGIITLIQVIMLIYMAKLKEKC